MSNFSEKVAFIWSVADLLRGPYKPHQYGDPVVSGRTFIATDELNDYEDLEFVSRAEP